MTPLPAPAQIPLVAQPPSAKERSDLAVIGERVGANARRDSVPAAEAVNTLVSTLSPMGTWPDIRYNDIANGSWSPTEHLSRVQRMALSYALPTGSDGDGTPNPNFHSAPLREALLRAFDGWFTVLPPGTLPAPAHPGNAFKDTLTTPTSRNWWHNEIGVPLKMSAILLLLPGEITGERRERGLQILARSWVPGDMSGINTGANLSWRARVTTVRAALTGDTALLHAVIAALGGTAHITDGEGIQADYSFWQHGPQFYQLGYGQGYSADMTELSELYRGTSFAFGPELVQTLTHLTLDGYQWAMRGSVGDYSAMGRGIANPRKDDTADLLNIISRLLAMGAPRQAEIDAFRDRLQKKADAAPLIGNRAFWRSGYLSHQRAGYSVSVRVTSKYLRGGEVINGQGMQSRYTGDGVTYLLRDGNEYRNLSPVVNFRRLPGTTGALSPQKPTMPGPYVWGVGSFAGVVSDGMYGAAGYDYARDGVSARKSWFFFDDEYMCLGADINADSAVTDPVVTSVEQCRLIDPVTRSLSGAAGAPWVAHGNTAYLFPGASAAPIAEYGPQIGSWRDVNSDSGDKTPVTENVFSLFLNHGIRPTAAGYAYIVVPRIAPKNLPVYAAALPVEVLANTPNCQAVRHVGLRLTEAVFYAPGNLTVSGRTISVSHACLLLLHESPSGGATITLADPGSPPTRDYDDSRVQQFLTVANPSQPAETILVEIAAPRPGVAKKSRPARLSFTMPTGMEAGQSVSKTLTPADYSAPTRKKQI